MNWKLSIPLLLAATASCSSSGSDSPAIPPHGDSGSDVSSDVSQEASPDVSADAAKPDSTDTSPVDDAPSDTVSECTPGQPGCPSACTAAHEVPVFVQPADDTVAFQSLLEASGYAGGAALAAVAAGDLCGGTEQELVVLKNAHSFLSVLRGPAPYAVGSGDLDSNALHPWRAAAVADLDNDGKGEVIAFRHVTAAGIDDVVVAKADSKCALSKQSGLVVGGASNSDWVAAAAGDFDGDGKPEVVGLKQAHSNFILLRPSNGALTLVKVTDLASDATHPWRALAAGDLDGDGVDELIAARQSADTAETVFVYRWDKTQSNFVEVSKSTVGNGGNSQWAGAAVGDFNGDGKKSIVLAKNKHSYFSLLELDSSKTLVSKGASDLYSVAGQPWIGIAAVDWLGGDQGAQELIAARSVTGTYQTNLFVHGNSFHRVARDSAVASTKAQYASEPLVDAGVEIDSELLKQRLTDTFSNAYSYLLWDTTGDDYLNLIRFLEATKDFCVHGRQLRVWVTLIPPTEHTGGKCSMPAESPLTPFAEASFFTGGIGPGACEDYVGWAALLGEVAALYPHLVAVNVDDFTHNVTTTFKPEMVARMESSLRAKAPWMNLAPTFYYHAPGGTPVPTAFPDLALSLDSILFYFRGEKAGGGLCAQCPPPGACSGACMNGTCSEKTVPNAPGEIADLASTLAEGRKLQVGVYATGHSTCGTPTPQYVYDMLKTALEDPHVAGTTVYTTKYPTMDCGLHLNEDMGCEVTAAYMSH